MAENDDIARAIAIWKAQGQKGTIGGVFVVPVLHDLIPELGDLYQQWLTLHTEDQRIYSAKYGQRAGSAMDIDLDAPEFDSSQLRQETKDAWTAYDTALRDLSQ